MMRQETIQSCIDILNKEFEGYIHFEHPVIVKKTPHQLLIRCIKVWAYNERLLIGKDGEANNWIDVYSFNENIEYVAGSILQKLKWLAHLKNK